MNLIKDFLLQITLIAIPMFTYHTFFSERLKDDKRENLVKAVFWGISLLLCMSFPAVFGSGYRLDIRTIPLLLGTLYCGYKTGVFLSFLIIIYRLFLSVDTGIYNTLFVLIFSVPIFIYFRKSFLSARKDKRVMMAVLLSVYYSMIGMAWFTILRSTEYFQIQSIHLILAAIFTWLFTTLNEMIRENHLLREEVQKADKFNVISHLTNVFAHEIRNPMQVTRGFLQLLDEPGLPEKKKGYIHLSIEELDRANGIINDLLSFGKPTENNTEKVDVGFQISRVANMVEPYAMTQNISIKTQVMKDCWIDANAQKLNQCLVNILKNAIESMPDGGEVYVSCGTKDDRTIQIIVEDKGIGMTKDEINRLGSPYYSLKESGTGLGMMVSLQIIHSFKGRVDVTSEKGAGTRFTISFPMEDARNQDDRRLLDPAT